jgi:hypothetical protein
MVRDNLITVPRSLSFVDNIKYITWKHNDTLPWTATLSCDRQDIGQKETLKRFCSFPLSAHEKAKASPNLETQIHSIDPTFVSGPSSSPTIVGRPMCGTTPCLPSLDNSVPTICTRLGLNLPSHEPLVKDDNSSNLGSLPCLDMA